MSKEILLVVEAVSNEKGVEKEVIFDELEAALASAARKRSGDEIDVRVAIDPATGDYETFRRWEVIEDDEEMEEESAQLFLKDAKEQDAEIEVGAFIEEPMENPEFGRIAAQTAKQVIVQRVRDGGDLTVGLRRRRVGFVSHAQSHTESWQSPPLVLNKRRELML